MNVKLHYTDFDASHKSELWEIGFRPVRKADSSSVRYGGEAVLGIRQ